MKKEELENLISKEIIVQLTNHVYSRTRNWATAEDITSATIMKAIEKPELFDGRNLIGWLKTIASRKATDDFRHRAIRTSHEGKVIAGEDDWSTAETDTGPEVTFQRAELWDIVSKLNDPCPDILKSFFQEGKTESEIAEEEAKGRSTIAGYKKDCLKQLKERIGFND